MSSAARWVVGPGDSRRLDDVLTRMGDIARGAAAEGRAFVNARRAAEGTTLEEGDVVEVWARREESADSPRILAQRGPWVIAYKPADLPAEPDRRGGRSLVESLAELLATTERPHATSRLDVGVSGAMLCAIGEAGRRAAASAHEAGEVHRTYVALAGGKVEGSGRWDAPIGRSRDRRGHALPVAHGRDAQPAVTRFTAIAWAGAASRRPGDGATTLLVLRPKTGRMHQLRVHASAAGAPLLGDRDRGGAKALVDRAGRVHPLQRIALHALRVDIDGPSGPLSAVAPIPAALREMWKALDGDERAWDEVAVEHPEP